MRPPARIPSTSTDRSGLQAIRALVRERLEAELLTLSARDRRALIRLLDSPDEPLRPEQRAELESELEVLDRRVAVIRRYLGQAHEPAHRATAQSDGIVLLDHGDGPHVSLLAELPVPEVEDVVVIDSPLGAALIGATAGAQVGYRTPKGPRRAALVEVED